MNSDSVRFLLDKFLERSFDRPATCFLRALEASLFVNELQGKKGRFLDIGCGDGFFDSLLPDSKDNDFVGLDIGMNNLKRFTGVFNGKKLVNASACSLPFKDDSFDYIISNSSIEHMFRLPEILIEMHRVLKPGAVLMLSLPLRSDLSRRGILYAFAESRYVRDHRIYNYLSDGRWTDNFKGAGFELVKKEYYLHKNLGRRLFLFNLIFNSGTGKIQLYKVIKKAANITEKINIRLIKNIMAKIAVNMLAKHKALEPYNQNNLFEYCNAFYVLRKR